MVFFLRGRVKGRRRDAELISIAPQHRDDRGFELHAAVRTSAMPPFRLARREEFSDARRTCAATNAFAGSGGLPAKPIEIAEMRHVDRDEEMRAVIGHAEIAIKRADLRAARTLREQPAQ